MLFKRYNSSINLKTIYSHGIKIYEDPLNQRNLIRDENNGKIGVYCWINKETGDFYIGSGDPLYVRISDYYQSWYYLSRSNTYIVRAIFKYGIRNFSLMILEYCESDNLIMCEQKWIDKLKPEYNINPIAGSTKGYKHTIESIEKMREVALGRKHTEEVK
jgi:group I intron endonuclease